MHVRSYELARLNFGAFQEGVELREKGPLVTASHGSPLIQPQVFGRWGARAHRCSGVGVFGLGGVFGAHPLENEQLVELV